MPPFLSGPEFDREKAASNLKKHGVSFAEAFTVFDDLLSSPCSTISTSKTNSVL